LRQNFTQSEDSQALVQCKVWQSRRTYYGRMTIVNEEFVEDSSTLYLSHEGLGNGSQSYRSFVIIFKP